MYCEIMYLLFVLYIGTGIIFYNNITHSNQDVLLFLSFMYLSYAAILLDSNLLSKCIL